MSFTVVDDSDARLYTLDLVSGSCELLHVVPRQASAGDAWESCDMLVSGGCVYALFRFERGDYVVRDLTADRAVTLPIVPDRGIRIDSIPDFWANDGGVTYLNHASHLGHDSMVVSCDWNGSVRWRLGTNVAFPTSYVYLWETSLCPQDDGSFLAFFNGNELKGGGDELWVGLLWIGDDGQIRDSMVFEWSTFTTDEHIECGGGVLIGGEPFIVVEVWEKTLVRGKTGGNFAFPAGPAPGKLQFNGVATSGGSVTVANGEGSVWVLQAPGRTGSEPTIARTEARTGLEPTL